MRVRVAQRETIEGWSVSLVLHVILLSVIWPVLRQLPVRVPPEPFRWNVTLVQSSQPSAAVESSTEDSPPRQDFHAADAVAQNPAPPTSGLPLLDQPNHESHMTVQPVKTVTPARVAVPPAPGETSPEESDVAPPMPSITEPTAATKDALPVQHEAVEHTQPLVAAAPVQAELSGSVATTQEQEAPVSPRPAASEAPVALDQAPGPSPAPPAAVPPTASSQFSGSRADYSWLQRAVSRRLEDLKRSSRPSLEGSSKLKVLVKAVVSRSGELMETEVVKSSGLARIDQEAVALVQRAFPVSLDEVIDRPQIVMRIPITYSRD